MSQRLRSDLVIGALRRAAEAADGFATVRHSGHPEAGIVWVLIAAPGGSDLYVETSQGEGDPPLFRVRLSGADDGAVDALLARERSFDPDLWVLEIEGVRMADLPGTVVD